MSLGCPRRPAGIPCRKRSLSPGSASIRFSSEGFKTCAGKMAFTRTPNADHSVLSSRVICTTAPMAIL